MGRTGTWGWVRWVWAAALCAVGATGSAVQSQEGNNLDRVFRRVPESLRPWIPWVVDGIDGFGCAKVPDGHVCLWPGHVKVDVRTAPPNNTKGTFVLRATLDRPGDVPLPGGKGFWPQAVRANGRAVAVLGDGSEPTVRLGAGKHVVTGEIPWDRPPETLAVPAVVGLVSLWVDGAPVYPAKRDPQGNLWLQTAALEPGGESSLAVDVHRRVDDGVPLTITTRLTLRVSGKARELNLGPVLLPGTSAIAINSPLPATLEEDGDLRIQLRAGEHDVDVVALAPGPTRALALKRKGDPWPGEEVWVWAADDRLRQVQVSGAPNIDTNQTSLPEEWKRYPAYLMHPERRLELKTLRRGQPVPPPNRLRVKRRLMLDLDGRGYTVRDEVSGTMHRGWRMTLNEGELGRVEVQGKDVLLTQEGDGRGVALRSNEVNMVADWRLPGALSSVPAVGWSEDVSSLSATLALPPGWMLLATTGVDSVDNTWVARWNLFDLFFVLVVALGVWRLVNWKWGLLALGTVVLTVQDAGAPTVIWLLLAAVTALVKVLPEGNVRRGFSWFGQLVVILATVTIVPFSIDQIRQALYPQAEPSGRGASFGGVVEPPPAPMSEATAADLKESKDDTGAEQAGKLSKRGSLERGGYGSSGEAPGDAEPWSARQDPDAKVQTGPGLPNWSWRSWELQWNGPVSKDHRMRLWVLSPWAHRLLVIGKVLALLLFLFMWASLLFARVRTARTGATTTTAAALMMLLMCVSPVSPAAAQGTPGPEVLEQLRTKLSERPSCHPRCVHVSQLTVQVRNTVLAVTAEVHTGEGSAYELPGPVDRWSPQEVRVDGSTTFSMDRNGDGFARVRLAPGPHRVELRGPVGDGRAMELSFGQHVPARVVLDAPGWGAEGVRSNGQVGGTIRLLRKAAPTRSETRSHRPSGLSPWLQVERTLVLGVRWEVYTVVRRVTPAGSPVVASVPLIAGESVTQPDLDVKNGHLLLNIRSNETELSWRSTLEPQPKLTLTAHRKKPWSEVWRLKCGPMWSCKASGLPPTEHVDGGVWSPLFHPYGGESLVLTFTRPKPAPGNHATVDRLSLSVRPGVRRTDVKLDAMVRASSGELQTWTLPRGVELQSVNINGEERSAKLVHGKLKTRLHPGVSNVSIHWQQGEGTSWDQRMPMVRTDARTVNTTATLHLPRDRWLLLAWGPEWGPVVLFWPLLIVILFAAFALGRIPHSPLRFWQWALLGLGLTQVPVVVSLWIPAWFFAFSYRQRRVDLSSVAFNLRQVGLVILTLVMLGALYTAVHRGLLVNPDMQVTGAGSTNGALRWYVDRTDGESPAAGAVSVPLWCWRVLMLLWSLWLAGSLLRWLRWGWDSFTEGGWKRSSPPPKQSIAGAAQVHPDEETKE